MRRAIQAFVKLASVQRGDKIRASGEDAFGVSRRDRATHFPALNCRGIGVPEGPRHLGKTAKPPDQIFRLGPHTRNVRYLRTLSTWKS